LYLTDGLIDQDKFRLNMVAAGLATKPRKQHAKRALQQLMGFTWHIRRESIARQERELKVTSRALVRPRSDITVERKYVRFVVTSYTRCSARLY